MLSRIRSEQRRRTARTRCSVVYDPNAVNPYGLELAALLSDGARTRVLHVCQDGNADHDRTFETRALLAGPIPTASVSTLTAPRLRYVVARVLGPVRTCAASWQPNRKLIVVWNRDPLDALVFALFALARRNVVMVLHNPAKLRAHTNVAMRMAERFLVACAQILVVHSPVHHSQLTRSQRARARVIPHLPYREWSRRWAPPTGAGRSSRAYSATSARADMLFVGAPRPDKGRSEMIGVLSNEILRGSTFRFVGPGDLPREWASAAADNEIDVLTSVGAGYASDAELADALRSSAVLVAPYMNATQSGTVMMALSCGIGVVAFASGALSDVVDPESLVPKGQTDVFAVRVRQYLAAPWRSSRFEVDTLAEECRLAWNEVIA